MVFYESHETDSNGDKVKAFQSTFSLDLSDFNPAANDQRMQQAHPVTLLNCELQICNKKF